MMKSNHDKSKNYFILPKLKILLTFTLGFVCANLLTYLFNDFPIINISNIDEDSIINSFNKNIINDDNIINDNNIINTTNDIINTTNDIINTTNDIINTTNDINSIINDDNNNNMENNPMKTLPGDNSNNNSPSHNNDNFCSAVFGKEGPKTSTSIWSSHIADIFKASKHTSDRRYEWHDFTAKLLNIITPQRLLNSVKSLPKTDYQWQTVGKISQLAFRRWQYLEKLKKGSENNSDEKPPRTVNILVFGGSVAQGVFCHHNPLGITRLTRLNCAWSSRLGLLLNQIFGYGWNGIFRIHSLAMGGTNTPVGTNIWDYGLMPSNMPYPDIIINAYSTNDMHVMSVNEAKNSNMTLEEMIMKVNQKFVRKVLQPRFGASCIKRQPLLMYFDDYIGNEQRMILETNAFSRASNVLSSYYGFNLISYADTVKDLVYWNTTEDWFSPFGWPDRQIHPGMGMHIASSWVVGFNMLNLAVTYCSLNSTTTSFDSDNGIDNHEERRTKKYLPINGLPELRDKDRKLSGEPFEVPNILPPELNDALSIDDISDIWMEKLKGNTNHRSTSGKNMVECDYNDSDESMPHPCFYSWIQGMNGLSSEVLTEKMKSVLVHNDGWEAIVDHNKLGYIPTKVDASFEIEFKNITSPALTLNFMFIKSYGDKWEGSQVTVDAFITSALDDIGDSNKSNNIQPTKSMNMTGFHDKNTSETYTVEMDLKSDGYDKGVEGEILNVRVKLSGGSTFKIVGMAVCDR